MHSLEERSGSFLYRCTSRKEILSPHYLLYLFFFLIEAQRRTWSANVFCLDEKNAISFRAFYINYHIFSASIVSIVSSYILDRKLEDNFFEPSRLSSDDEKFGRNNLLKRFPWKKFLLSRDPTNPSKAE